jgi:hypothetical protein
MPIPLEALIVAVRHRHQHKHYLWQDDIPHEDRGIYRVA